MKLKTQYKIPILIDDELIEQCADEYLAAGGELMVGITFGLYVDLRNLGMAEPLAPIRSPRHVA